MVEKPEETVWIGLEYFCAEGDDFWNMSDQECVDFAVKELTKMGVITEGAVLDAHREKVKKHTRRILTPMPNSTRSWII